MFLSVLISNLVFEFEINRYYLGLFYYSLFVLGADYSNTLLCIQSNSSDIEFVLYCSDSFHTDFVNIWKDLIVRILQLSSS